MIKKYAVMLLFIGLITACIGENDKAFIGKWKMEGAPSKNINFYSFLKEDGEYVVFNGEDRLTEGEWKYLSPSRIKVDVWHVGDKTKTVRMSMEGVMDKDNLIMMRDGVSKKFGRIE